MSAVDVTKGWMSYNVNVEGVLTIKGKEQKKYKSGHYRCQGGRPLLLFDFTYQIADYDISGFCTISIAGKIAQREPRDPR